MKVTSKITIQSHSANDLKIDIMNTKTPQELNSLIESYDGDLVLKVEPIGLSGVRFDAFATIIENGEKVKTIARHTSPMGEYKWQEFA